MAFLYWLLPLVFLCSLVGTWMLRHYAVSRSILDVPNARSSHQVPTPRGGGVAVVVTFLAGLPVLAALGAVSFPAALGLWGAGALVAAIGWLDDHGHVAARWRLLKHFGAAAWLLYWLNGLAPVTLFGFWIDFGWTGHIFTAFYLVWMLNLYNFMDGIDGLAGVQALTVALGCVFIYSLLGEIGLMALPLLLCASVAGFLVWNFPPARIFMGDAGSGFLGFMIGALSLHAAWAVPEMLWSWQILMGVFIIDATFTLIRRLCNGEKAHEAHRTHAYQYASRHYGSHRAVTLRVLVINVLWLLPLATFVALEWLDGPLAVLIAYTPLVVLAVRFNAGRPEPEA
ncbi:MAG: Fuc2NAc and GlcNAc transferase [Alloalcanivorax sp.]|jgi:Fuc2NAc and GlcNAc transferase